MMGERDDDRAKDAVYFQEVLMHSGRYFSQSVRSLFLTAAVLLTLGAMQAVAAAPKRIRVSGPVEAGKCIQCPPPAYPALARQAHVQGVVQLDAVIGTDGKVKSVQLISGHPLLSGAAMQAVRGWKYKPTAVDGAPVEVETTVSVNFNMAG